MASFELFEKNNNNTVNAWIVVHPIFFTSMYFAHIWSTYMKKVWITHKSWKIRKKIRFKLEKLLHFHWICSWITKVSRKLRSKYRPVSTTSIICKIFASILKKVIKSHLKTHELITVGIMNKHIQLLIRRDRRIVFPSFARPHFEVNFLKNYSTEFKSKSKFL